MTFETLNENVMLLELTNDEMKKFNITYESLSNESENTQTAIKSLLQRIDVENRMSRGEKVVVEALPIEDGGCFFIFTFTRTVKRRYKVKKSDISLIFKAERLNDFLDFVSVVKSGMKINQQCEAYELKNEYYLFIPKKNDKLNAVVSEFGNISHNVDYQRLREYGRCLGKVYLQ